MNSIFTFVGSNLLVACIIACLALAVGRSGRFATAAHFLWLFVFVKLITPPIVQTPIAIPYAWAQPLQSVLRVMSADSTPPISQSTLNATALIGANKADSMQRAHASRPDTLGAWSRLNAAQYALLLWVCGSSLIFVRGIWRFVRFSRLLHRESVIDEDASNQVRKLVGSRQFAPPVRLIAARVSPMLFGIGRRTCIVCPQRLWQSLTLLERRGFLAHEVAHFRRRDHWVRWLEWSVTAIYWWLPLVYIARKHLERHEEAACDAWAIANLQTPPRDYAEALLSVVDFLSETSVGVPRIASRMQPTDSLEERLRWIMAADKTSLSQTKFRSLRVTCVALLIIHPSLHLATQAAALKPEIADATSDHVERAEGRIEKKDASDDQGLVAVPLPPAPRGWWNERPSPRFADVRLGDHDLRMLADAGRGVLIQAESGSTYAFDPDSVRALAYVPSTSRMIIGNLKGELHLWDAKSSQFVSLIGKHPSAIASLAYHPVGGLVSGDREGNLIRWDIQSGQMLEVVSVANPVGSVRWSRAGDQLAVVVGSWSAGDSSVQLHVRDGRSLESLQELSMPSTIAVAQHDAESGWLAIDWSGGVWSLSTSEFMGQVPKADVSGMVLCQELFTSAMQSSFRKRLE